MGKGKTAQGSVLVVDDEEGFRLAFLDNLEPFGYETITVASGEEALNHIRKRSFSLVLLDGYLNGLSGMKTLARIKDMHPDQPVLIMSMMSSYLEEEALSLGAWGCVEKPTDGEMLRRLVDQAKRSP